MEVGIPPYVWSTNDNLPSLTGTSHERNGLNQQPCISNSYVPRDRFPIDHTWYQAQWDTPCLSKTDDPPNLVDSMDLDFCDRSPSFLSDQWCLHEVREIAGPDHHTSKGIPSKLNSPSASTLSVSPPSNITHTGHTFSPVFEDFTIFPAPSDTSCQPLAVKKDPVQKQPTRAKRGRPRKRRSIPETPGLTAESSEDCATRVPHHEVERKYREGLNASFRRLQCAVPTLPQPSDGVGTARPSKAVVIASAIDYIERLEKERDDAIVLKEKFKNRCSRPGGLVYST